MGYAEKRKTRNEEGGWLGAARKGLARMHSHNMCVYEWFPNAAVETKELGMPDLPLVILSCVPFRRSTVLVSPQWVKGDTFVGSSHCGVCESIPYQLAQEVP